MIKFNELYLDFKNFIENNSQYGAKVVKNVTNKTTYFPIVAFTYVNSVNTNDATVDRIEYYDREYFEITIYAQDKGDISRNIISDELINLTQKYMGDYKNMYRTGCKPIFNIDESIARTIITYQCQVGNIYGNIIRR